MTTIPGKEMSLMLNAPVLKQLLRLKKFGWSNKFLHRFFHTESAIRLSYGGGIQF